MGPAAHAGELQDPALGELFRAMAREEGGHAEAVRRALALWTARSD